MRLKNNVKTKKVVGPKGINKEYLNVYTYRNVHYIPLITLADVIGIKPSTVYNAVNRLSDDIQKIAIKQVIIPDFSPRKGNITRCLNVEYLRVLLDRMSSSISDIGAKFLDNEIKNLCISDKTIKLDSLNVVTYIPTNIVNHVYKERVPSSTSVDLDESVSQSSLEVEQEPEISEENLQVSEVVTSVDTTVNSAPSNSNSDVYSMLSGLLDTLKDYENIKHIKPEYDVIKSEYNVLKAENDTLKNKINALEDELFKVKSELEFARRANEDIVSKANLIKNYVSSFR